MKKYIFRILAVAFAIGLVIACTKDVEVEDTFNFDFSVLKPEEAYLGVTTPFHIVVTPERQVSNVHYKLKYEMISGTGSFSGISLSDGVVLPSLDCNYDYIGTTPGTHTIRITVTSDKGVVKVHDYDIIIKYQPFIFNFALASTNTFVNTPINITATLLSGLTTVTAPQQYNFKYVVNGGTGLISKSGVVIPVSTNSIFTSGNTDLIYQPTTIGQHTIVATAVAADGNTIERQLVINVTSIPVTFSATALPQGYVNQPMAINFVVTPQTASSTTYQLNYILTQGSGLLYSTGTTVVTPGTYNSVSPGTFTYNYTPTSAGDHILTFKLKDSNGVETTVTVTITVQNIGFNLSTSGDGTLIINNIKDFYTYLTQTVTDPSISYQVRYTVQTGSTGAGQVLQAGNTLALGQFNVIQLGTTSLQFKGTSIGTVNLLVEVKDSNNIIHSSTIVFNVTGIVFTFSGGAQSNNLFVAETTSLNFNITETSPSGTNYEMKYVFSQGNGTVSNGASPMSANVYYPVNVGAFSRSFTSTQSGQTKIIFTCRNTTTLVESTQEIILNSAASTFTFNAQNISNNQNIGTGIGVNFTLTQQGTATTSYVMTFATSGTGTFTYNGTTYTAGQPITVSPGSFSGVYVGSTAGAHNVVFSVSNTNTTVVTASDTVNLTYTSPDFSISTSGDGSLIVNNSKDFYVYLTQSVSNPSITYQVRYTIVSGSTGAGQVLQGTNIVPLGIYNSIPVGSSSLQFKGTSPGTVNLLVEVKDSYNVVHSSTVAFTVNSISYAFNGSAQSNALYIGESTSLNFNITETSPSGTNYEMKYVFSQGNGTVSNGASSMSANVYYPVNVGTFSRTFTSTQVGSTKILFTCRNTTTLVETTQEITINSSQSTFTFTANSLINNQVVGTNVPVNFLLTQQGNSTTTYTMTFATSGTGTFTYNGTTYTAGQPITVSPGSFSGVYVGSTAGAHNVVFTIVNGNTPPITVNDSVTITYTYADFSLSTSGDGNVIINSLKDFNVFLTQLSPNASITYQVRYTYDSGTTATGEVQDAAGTVLNLGQLYPINIGNTQMKYKALTLGVVKLKVEIIDSNNLAHSSVIQFTNQSINYTFTGSAQNNSMTVDSVDPVNFNITETSPSETNYEIKYEITSGACNVLDGSTPMNTNVWYPVNIGAFSKNIQGTVVGTVKVLFTVRNTTTLIEHTQDITIVFTAIDFTLSTSGDGTTNINSLKDFNVFLNQIGTINPSVTYQVRFNYSSGTTATGEVQTTSGQVIPMNTYTTITTGTTLFKFKALTQGVVKLNVEVLNSYNVSHSSIVQFNIPIPTFSFNIENYFDDSPGHPLASFSIDNEVISNDNYDVKITVNSLSFVPDPNTALSNVEWALIPNSAFSPYVVLSNTYQNFDAIYNQVGSQKLFKLFAIAGKYSNFNVTLSVKNSYGYTQTATLNHIGAALTTPLNFVTCFTRSPFYVSNATEYSVSLLVNGSGIGSITGSITNVKIYKSFNNTETLWYSGPMPNQTAPNKGWWRSGYQTGLTDLYSLRVVITDSFGNLYEDNLGTNYTANYYGAPLCL